MKIRNGIPIKNVLLAVAALALAAPMAHSQIRQYNAVTGKYTIANTSHVYHGVNAHVNRGYRGSNITATLNDFSPYVVGSAPYAYNDPGLVVPQGGTVVLGSDGQIYDPYANSVSDPSYSRNGVTLAAPVKLSDQIETVNLADNRIRIAWSGDPRPVAIMKFSLLDSRRIVLRNTVVTDMPAEAIFTRPSNAVYYRVVITYSDGAMRSIVAPL